MYLFLKAMAIGLSIAAPVGPIGLICIRRSITQGAKHGFAAGLGAATADGLYSCVAAFGLTMVADLLTGFQIPLQLAGGIFLCYLGYSTYFAQAAQTTASEQSDGILLAYLSVFLLTLTNPMTVMMFMAIFTGMGVVSGVGDYVTAGVFVVGVFSGSAGWWLLLSGMVSRYRTSLEPRYIVWINQGSGLVLGGFGIVALVGLLKLL